MMIDLDVASWGGAPTPELKSVELFVCTHPYIYPSLSARAKAGCKQQRSFAASGLPPLALIELLNAEAARLANESSLQARPVATLPTRGANWAALPRAVFAPEAPSAHGSQQATSKGWRQERGIRLSNVWTPPHRKPATYCVEYNAACARGRGVQPAGEAGALSSNCYPSVIDPIGRYRN